MEGTKAAKEGKGGGGDGGRRRTLLLRPEPMDGVEIGFCVLRLWITVHIQWYRRRDAEAVKAMRPGLTWVDNRGRPYTARIMKRGWRAGDGAAGMTADRGDGGAGPGSPPSRA